MWSLTLRERLVLVVINSCFILGGVFLDVHHAGVATHIWYLVAFLAVWAFAAGTIVHHKHQRNAPPADVSP